MRWLPILLCMSCAASFASECTVTSGTRTAALVELYTSEGCSSCPPAERWLSTLRSPALSGLAVPIAFHVSYWDYIGWKDVYADARFTDRQRDLAKSTGSRMVYTPQVMLAGRDYLGWHDGRDVSRSIEALNRIPARARLQIAQATASGAGVTGVAVATLPPGAKAGDVALFVAVTQGGISSRVTAGENRGENLNHDFVARDLAVIREAGGGTPAVIRGTYRFEAKTGWNPEKMSVVAFLQNLKTGEVLQALSTPVCRG